ncbi:MAG: ImmA/IrrE family metallo-endopeptidase [Planctomycetes bacterium]|nr:ImmA/IrrE family metallo-endopeptidase [Planctomycetota bacterium]
MIEPRLIKTTEEHEAALAEIERLMSLDPDAGTPEARRLELFAKLVEDYERERFPFETPGPIEAIRFRMSEQGLKQRHLVPFIGSKSKVSEVLAGKRPLTAEMMRALHEGLGIPARVLLLRTKRVGTATDEPDWSRFPFREMSKRGWLRSSSSTPQRGGHELLRDFFDRVGDLGCVQALCRRSIGGRAGRSMDAYALQAWTARIILRAREVGFSRAYKPETLTDPVLRELASLSTAANGPTRAREFLSEHGIALVIERHLPRTRLDAAATMATKDNPVIGMTLRYDRIDHFWFTLFHELAHVLRHLPSANEEVFVDDLDILTSGDRREREADRIASDILIPPAAWRRSTARTHATPEAAVELAAELRIHPAIVAGRMRRERQDYRILSGLVGNGQVRGLFAYAKWK